MLGRLIGDVDLDTDDYEARVELPSGTVVHKRNEDRNSKSSLRKLF
ncbi:MAG: hypothetical protein ACQET3_13200 [Promethearchaeati archaeon]